MSRQNELNPLLWLATQASKMVLFCENFVFWITLHVHVTSCSKLTKCIQRNCINNNNEAVLTMSTSNSCLYSDLNCSLEIIDQDFEFAQKVIFMPQSCTCTLEYKWCAKLIQNLGHFVHRDWCSRLSKYLCYWIFGCAKEPKKNQNHWSLLLTFPLTVYPMEEEILSS